MKIFLSYGHDSNAPLNGRSNKTTLSFESQSNLRSQLRIRVITTLILLLCIHNNAWSQTLQRGIVKEYNERLAKTPLGQVEIVVANAGSTVSDSDGRFSLQFRTSKSGDKVNVRRVERLGYEVFNKEALNQWYITKEGNPFSIVMCRSDKFKRIRDNYNAISSASYEKQRIREEKLLEEEYRKGILKEEEYRLRIDELKDEYERQLEDIDKYIDRFARIDLSELSKQEASIIACVQNGNMDEAISLYERQSFINHYKQECAAITELKNARQTLQAMKQQKSLARDSVYASILRQVNTYMLAGGMVNIEKGKTLLRECALADTTYLDALWEYAYFLDNQNEYEEAVRYYNMYVNQCTDRLSLTSLFNNLGAIYVKQEDYSKAEYYFKTNLANSRRLYAQNKESYWDLAIRDLHNLGTLYDNWEKADSSAFYYSSAFAVYEQLTDSLTDEELADKSMLYNNYGAFCFKQKKLEDAALNYQRAVEIREKLYATNNILYRPILAMTLHNIGALYHEKGDYDAACKYYLESLRMRKIMVESNPSAYKEDLNTSLTNMIGLVTEVNNLAGQYVDEEKFKEAFPLYVTAQTLYEELCKTDTTYLADYMNVAYWAGVISDEVFENSGQAIPSWVKSLDVCLKLYQDSPDNYLVQLVTICNRLAYAYAANKLYDQAIETIDIAIQAADDEANLYDTKGEILLMAGKETEAVKMWNKVVELEPDFLSAHGESELYKQLKSKKLVK